MLKLSIRYQMTNKLIIIICLMLVGCTSASSVDDTSIFKICIDTLLKTRDYNYLKSTNMVVVKNTFSQHIDISSLNKKNITSENFGAREIKIYIPQDLKKLENKIRYFEITKFSACGWCYHHTTKYTCILHFKIISL